MLDVSWDTPYSTNCVLWGFGYRYTVRTSTVYDIRSETSWTLL